MPEGTLRRGAPLRGPPKHQNKFAFKHNKNSKKTKMIQKIHHDGLCKRCHEKIEWRKKYRKYKPLAAPAHCNGCKQRTVKRAYHTLCDSCAGGRGVCAKCAVKLSEQEQAEGEDVEEDEEDMDGEDMEDQRPPTAGEAKTSSLKGPAKIKEEEDEDEEDDDVLDEEEMMSEEEEEEDDEE